MNWQKSYDLYDIWGLRWAGNSKRAVYKGSVLGGLVCAIVVLLDFVAPVFFRRLLGVKPTLFPAHVVAMIMEIRALTEDDGRIAVYSSFLSQISSVERHHDGCAGWGLPFDWFSKNGHYPAGSGFSTNTPYVMEALSRIISDSPENSADARRILNNTLSFFDALPRQVDTNELLALSYAIATEDRVVPNANSYSALAYALLAVQGPELERARCRDHVERIVRWLLREQSAEGYWRYYADNLPGNFVDGFHTCFIMKNLLKVSAILPELQSDIEPAVVRCWNWFREMMIDKSGLVKRFHQGKGCGLFKYEIYDQAEYLGLLVDFGLLDEASTFKTLVLGRFSGRGVLHCRIDWLGRKWGAEFIRWGIAPFELQLARFESAREKIGCVES